MSSRKRRRAPPVRAVSSTQIAPARSRASVLLYSNAEQFNAIRTSRPLVLFYRDNAADDVNASVFDPELDERLVQMHADPYNLATFSLAGYEACVTRASYELRYHPQQEAVIDIVSNEVSGINTDTALVLVYRRDDASVSPALNRFTNPMCNTLNGLNDGTPSTELVFFSQHSFEPVFRGQIIWQRSQAVNSTIGIIAVRYLGQA